MRPIRVIFWLLCGLIVMRAGALHAQYTGDYQTNIISGVISNWSGDYVVGPNFDALSIVSGGVLNDTGGGLGGGSFNIATVSGNGSTWNNTGDFSMGGNRNQLVISAGGAVYDSNSQLGNAGFSTGGDTVLVTGRGSIWSNRNDFTMAGGGGSNLTITNGGAVFNNNAKITGEQGDSVLVTGTGSMWSILSGLNTSSGDGTMTVSAGAFVHNGSATISGFQFTVLITGAGSVWDIGGGLNVIGRFGDNLTVADGGVVKVSDASTLRNAGSIAISGGVLSMTNGLGSAVLTINDGSLTINSGTLTLDQIITTDPKYSIIVFNGGLLRSKATTIVNNSGFTVGDGTDAATFIMDTGGSGFHSFANGLTISSNGVLKGVGTIIGTTTVNGGGVLAPGLSPGSITFSNSLTLAPNSTFAVELDGSAEGQYDRIVALDTASLSNSVLSVSLGFTPSAGDSFTIISNLSATAVLGTFVTTDGMALPDGAEFSVDGTTFEIDYNANADGQDVVLTALIPEPSSFLLTAAGAVVLWTVTRRKRKRS